MENREGLLRNYDNTTFLGVQATQYAVDLILWEHLFRRYPGVRNILELGTQWGGFSLLLALYAEQYGATFRSYDNGDFFKYWISSPGPAAWQTKIGQRYFGCFVQGDVFNECHDEVVSFIKRPGRSILFCDNGDKPREFRTFAPVAKPGDLIVLHDWGHEIGSDDIDFNLVDQVMVDDCEAVGSISAFFIRKDT